MSLPQNAVRRLRVPAQEFEMRHVTLSGSATQSPPR